MDASLDNCGPFAADSTGSISFYYEAGTGSAVVLLHGIGSSGASWYAQLRGLSHLHRVIAWDAPGYMKSAPLRERAPVASDYANRLKALLDYLGISSCYLVGHSLGALIAASLARSWGEYVSGLILANPAQGYGTAPADIRQEKLSSRIDAFRELGAAEFAKQRGPRLLSDSATADQIRCIVSIMSELNEGAHRQAARMLASGDLFADARRFDGPTLVIGGSEDKITPADDARDLAARLRSAEYRSIDGAGHASYVEQAERFSELIREFVSFHTNNNKQHQRT